jgi:hypothetical protein
MMQLNVSDLVYLDFFRLTREGTTVGNYLRWFPDGISCGARDRRAEQAALG